jgi:hypothetical protein
LIRTVGFFLHPGKILFQPVGFLVYSFFFAQRKLRLFAKLGATGKLHVGSVGSHLSKLSKLPNNQILNFYSIRKI